jgi:hypothetical protein
MADIDVHAQLMTCAHCGAPLDRDEQLWLELDNGSIRASSMLAFDEPLPARRAWHVGCVARATQLAAGEQTPVGG